MVDILYSIFLDTGVSESYIFPRGLIGLPFGVINHNERARVAPHDFLKILFVHRKKRNAHTTLAWCLVRLLAVVGFFWARSLAPLVLILVLAL